MEFFTWDVDPVLIELFGLKIHWYGALFATAIFAGLQVLKWIFQQEKIKLELLDSLLVYAVIGIIVGARVGHCLFYDPEYYLSNPLKILAIWEGGLASHGGGLGVIIAMYFFARKNNLKFLWILDRVAIATAMFGFFVRFANFMNSEIIGIPTDFPWAVVFARVDMLPRHPAQLYESLAYLSICISLLMMYRITNISKHTGAMLGAFLCSVFTARYLIELVKVKQAAYASESFISTGQMLSIPFFVVGVYLLVNAWRKSKS